MTKAVLISIRPEWCTKIASGEKTIEVRKTRPKLQTPFKCYIYCTNPRHYVDSRHWFSYPAKPLWITANKDVKSNQERGDGDCILLNGKVIGEFVCDNILELRKRGADDNFDYCYLPLNVFGNDDIEPYINCIKHSCIEKTDLNTYGTTANCLYGWHISDLKIYDTPKELSEFRKPELPTGLRYENDKITRPFQSWGYVEELT